MDSLKGMKILYGEPHYIIVEEIDSSLKIEEEIQRQIESCCIEAEKRTVGQIYFIIKQSSLNYNLYHKLLINNEFKLSSRTVTYKLHLGDKELNNTSFTYRGLREISESEFNLFWQMSMLDSYNSPSSLSIDEQFEAMKQELGEQYKQSCIVIYDHNVPLGVIMPHIEPGTVDEGRLFYFGLLPEHRGKGYASEVHKMGLRLLKEMGASYYIGSTSEKNVPMIKVFQKNGCRFLDKEERYDRILRKSCSFEE